MLLDDDCASSFCLSVFSKREDKERAALSPLQLRNWSPRTNKSNHFLMLCNDLTYCWSVISESRNNASPWSPAHTLRPFTASDCARKNIFPSRRQTGNTTCAILISNCVLSSRRQGGGSRNFNHGLKRYKEIAAHGVPLWATKAEICGICHKQQLGIFLSWIIYDSSPCERPRWGPWSIVTSDWPASGSAW